MTAKLGPAARPPARADHLPAGRRSTPAGDRFRALYPDHAIAPTPAFPGAHEALAAVRRHGGRIVLVTGKYTPNAQLHVDHLGLDVDHLEGWVWGAGKADGAARARARRSTSATTSTTSRAPAPPASLSVSVLTGGCTREELRGGRHRRRPRRPRPSSRPGSTSTCSTTRLAALEARPARARLGAGRLQRRRRQRVPAGRRGARARRRAGSRRRRRTPTRCPQAERDPAREFAESLGVEVLTPRDPRDGARGLPRQRRRPLLLLQGRAARRARAAGRRARARRTSPPAPTPTTPCAGFRPGIRAAAERGAVDPAARRRPHQGPGPRGLARAGACRPGTSRPRPACPPGSPTASRSPRTGWPGSSGPRPPSGRRSTRPAYRVRDLRVRDLGRPGPVEVDAGAARRPVAGTPTAVLAAVREAGFDDGERRPAGLPVRLDERAAARPGPLPLNSLATVADARRRLCARRTMPQPRPEKRSYRAHWQGEVVRRREGLRLPVPGGRRRRLRARRRAARRASPRSRPGTRVEFGIAQGRTGDQALQVRVLDAPAVGRAQPVARRSARSPRRWSPIVEDLIRLLDGVGEAYRHGRHPDARRPPSRPPSCCARWPTSSSSRAAAAADRLGTGRRPSATATAPVARRRRAADQHEDRPGRQHARRRCPGRAAGSSGSAMPTKPPTTQASWSSVSERANALGLHPLGDVALDRRVERELAQRLGQPGGEAEQRQRRPARRTAPRPAPPRRRRAARPRR